MNSAILVADGADLIGFHLCEHLVAAGEEILCLDNFRTGEIRWDQQGASE